MNLVKAQEYAQSLPIPDLQKYVDGMNPAMIPPWVATGVMQAKTKLAEMANNRQGAAQGEQPSVKEQIEQKAGLLGLQQAQQGAQQQAMMQARPMSGPVPTGTPQPEAQPQPPQMAGLDQLQSNIKMAGGGIVAFATGDKVKAGPEFIKFLQSMGIDYTDFVKSPAAAQDSIKDMFRSVQGSPPAAQAAPTPQTVQGSASPKAFAAGQAMRPAIDAAKNAAKTKLIPGANIGLAAYQGLGEVSDAQGFYDDPNVPMAEKIKQFARTGARTALPIAGGAVGSLIPAPVAGTIAGAAAGTGLAALIDQEGDALKKYRESQKGDMASENARLAAKAPAPDMGTEGRRTGQVATGNGINVSPNLIPASARPKPQGNVPQNVNPNAVKVNPNAPPAAPAAPAPDSMEAMYRTSLEGGPKERKVEDLIAEDQDIKKRLGLDEPAGKAKLERIEEMNKQYAATQLSPMDELIAMLGKSGQYKGLSGLAPAYTSMAEKKRAADAAQAKMINELMGGVEDTQRGEKTTSATGVRTAREKDVGDVRAFDREKLQSLGTARGQDIQADVTRRGQDMTYRAAMAAAAQRGDNQEIAKINAASQLAARDETINNWQAQLKELAKMPIPSNKAKIVAIEKQINDRTKAIYGQFGITIPEAPGAASPGGTSSTPPPGAVREVKR
jgi:hypothetical protein